MNNKPTLELSPEDSRKLFEMIVGGAKPADIFETFDPNEAHYYIKGGLVVNDIADPDSLVAKAIVQLGGELPKVEMDGQLPPGIPPESLEAKLIAETPPPAVAVIHIGRKGEKRGFGFDAPIGAMDAGSGEVVGVSDDGTLQIPSMRPGGEKKGGMPREVAEALTARILGDLGGAGSDKVRVTVGKIRIKGGQGDGVDIELEKVEIIGPDHTSEVLAAMGGGEKTDS